MTREKRIKKSVEKLTIMDDTLFEKMAEDIGFCEELISTVLQQKVKVISAMPQKSVKNLQGRSVRLDLLCVLENGKKVLVEVQKSNDDDHVKRVRYNTSCVTANITDPGVNFEDVPDLIAIYITKFDIFKGKKAIYHIERIVHETDEVQDNGIKEIYVNTKVDDGTDISELMKIFKSRSKYDFKKFPNTSKRKSYFLKNERGRKELCKVVDECVKEEAKEIAADLFRNGANFDLVRKSIRQLSDEELKEIYEDVKERSFTHK